MDLTGHIIIGIFLLILVVGAIAIAYVIGKFVGESKYLKLEYERAVRQCSWASVNTAQAAFNSDFFEELWAANDSRLTIG